MKRVQSRYLFYLSLLSLSGCMGPLYRQSGPSHLANLTGHVVSTPEEAEKDLYREQDQGGIKIYALLYTEPYIRSTELREAYKEGLLPEVANKRANEKIKLLAKDHTAFRVEISGPTQADTTFKYWSASLVDSYGKERPAELISDP